MMAISQKTKGELYIFAGTILSGIAFVGSRKAMGDAIGPFTYNAWRHVVSTIFLFTCRPWLEAAFHTDLSNFDYESSSEDPTYTFLMKLKNRMPSYLQGSVSFDVWFYGAICGVATFFASALIQIGLLTVSAGKAAFIAGLFVIVIPIMEYMLPGGETRISKLTWIAALTSGMGMYFLSGGAGAFTFGIGEFFVFLGMLCWAVSIMASDAGAKRVDCILLTCYEFLVTTILCITSALYMEPQYWKLPLTAIHEGWDMFIVVGLAEAGSFTFTTLGQMHTSPSRAALLMSLEAISACVLGYVFLAETLSAIEMIGCFLMVLSTLITTIPMSRKESATCPAPDIEDAGKPPNSARKEKY